MYICVSKQSFLAKCETWTKSFGNIPSMPCGPRSFPRPVEVVDVGQPEVAAVAQVLLYPPDMVLLPVGKK